MDKDPTPETPADCDPVFSVAGVMPGANEAAWKTAYPNPDAELPHDHRPTGHGPSFSIAGVSPGGSEVAWRTAMPDPTRDTIDAYGHVITKSEAAARAEFARAHQPEALKPAKETSTKTARDAA
jgi:hypothetical protein